MKKTHEHTTSCSPSGSGWCVMGLNGPEFKTTRDHLLANLDGDRAWRYDKDSYESAKKRHKSERER